MSLPEDPATPSEESCVAFHIRPNLAGCLRHLRLPESDRRLWVDALSISQTNIEEMNQQVGNIGRIFRGASRVLA